MSLEQLIYSVLIAVSSWVYVCILTNEGMILDWWAKFLNRIIRSQWLLKPLVECEYCVSGQIALWFYVLKYWNEYNLLTNIFFVTLTIFLTNLMNEKD